MSDLVNRLRLRAEDLHPLNPAGETVKCLSLGADEIERLRARVKELEHVVRAIGNFIGREYLVAWTDKFLADLVIELLTERDKQLDAFEAENARMKAELKSIEGALDDPRANLTLTTAEIIRELKAQLATSPLPLTQG